MADCDVAESLFGVGHDHFSRRTSAAGIVIIRVLNVAVATAKGYSFHKLDENYVASNLPVVTHEQGCNECATAGIGNG